MGILQRSGRQRVDYKYSRSGIQKLQSEILWRRGVTKLIEIYGTIDLATLGIETAAFQSMQLIDKVCAWYENMAYGGASKVWEGEIGQADTEQPMDDCRSVQKPSGLHDAYPTDREYAAG